MKILLLLTICFSISACSIFNKKDKKNEKDFLAQELQRKKVLEDFEKGNQHLDNREFEKARQVFDKILKENPVTGVDTIVLYNSGVAYEGLKKCKTAAGRYRRVIRLANKEGKLKTYAMLRLSYTYICMGRNDKAIVNLIDVRKRKRHLPEEVGQAEVPARLAAAYARNGNRKLAKKFFKEAELGIRKLQAKHKNPKIKRETLAKTLFLMGNMRQLDPSKIKAEDYLESLRSLQGYLLQSVELGSKKWSPRAKDQISGAYDKVWDLVEGIKVDRSKEATLAVRKELQAKAKLIQDALYGIEELRGLRFPETRNVGLVQSLFRDLGRKERQFKKFLADNQVGSSLTQEAQKREGLKREGRTANPNPVLEKRFQKPTQLPDKKTN